jgi:hypothetical protein
MRIIPLLALAALLLVAGGVLIWGIRTCRKLWRTGSTPWEVCVYGSGVKGFGSLVALGFVVYGAYVGWTRVAITEEHRLPCAFVGAAFAAVFGTPVALGWGYLWGTKMAAHFGYAPPDEDGGAKQAGSIKRPPPNNSLERSREP